MDQLEFLEEQAWNLKAKLYKLIEAECIQAARTTPPARKNKLLHAHIRAYERFLRRLSKL